jgi:NAD(P)-dependent dehydrogenase (short-subunit alcohol dehydrogenase family)
MVKTTLVEAVSPRRLRNTSYHRAPGSADRLAENQLVAPRAARRTWDVTGAVLFLTSDDAAFITGQAIVVDGGQYRIG